MTALEEIRARVRGIDNDIDYFRSMLKRPWGGPVFASEEDVHTELSQLYTLHRQYQNILKQLEAP